MNQTPPSRPLRLEIRRQFGQLQYRLAPLGAEAATCWSAPFAARSALVAALGEALGGLDFAAGQSVIFRGDAYQSAAALRQTVAFTANL